MQRTNFVAYHCMRTNRLLPFSFYLPIYNTTVKALAKPKKLLSRSFIKSFMNLLNWSLALVKCSEAKLPQAAEKWKWHRTWKFLYLNQNQWPIHIPTLFTQCCSLLPTFLKPFRVRHFGGWGEENWKIDTLQLQIHTSQHCFKNVFGLW